MEILLFCIVLFIVIIVIVMNLSRRSMEQKISEPQAVEQKPYSKPKDTLISPPSLYNLKTVGDFLKLVGMRVSFGTKQDGFYEGDVEDISDSGSHLILNNVRHMQIGATDNHYESKNIPVTEINFIEVIDRRNILT
jgi:hypothetical protein